MLYMMLVKATKDSEDCAAVNPELIAAIGKLAEDATARGLMVSAGGLKPSSEGLRVRVSGGKTFITDGPFAETRELVGGFAIFNLESREEAVKMATDFMQLHADILGPTYEGELEVRPMFDSPPQAAKA